MTQSLTQSRKALQWSGKNHFRLPENPLFKQQHTAQRLIYKKIIFINQYSYHYFANNHNFYLIFIIIYDMIRTHNKTTGDKHMPSRSNAGVKDKMGAIFE